MDISLLVRKKNNKSRLDSYCRPEQCIDHIPYCHSGLSRAHFFPTTFLEIAVYSHGFYELSRMLMRKNVNNDVSKDSPTADSFNKSYRIGRLFTHKNGCGGPIFVT